jgi:DNA polymerase III sliding clamp (beta) subunit (PCNA family)
VTSDTRLAETPVVPPVTAQFETKKFVLQGLLQKAMAVLPKTDLVQVLTNFQIEVTAGKEPSLRVAATDLDLWALASTNIVTVSEGGTITLPGAKLTEIAESAEEGDLVVEARNGMATISVKRTKWELRLADGSEYPPFPDLDDHPFHSIERAPFVSALQAVAKAATKEATRQNLAMVDIRDGQVRAADGVRYHQVGIISWPKGFDTHIPIGAVDVLVKMLKATEAPTFQLGDTGSQVVFLIGPDVYVASKLVVEFPAIDQALLNPALANDEPLEIDRRELLGAIRRVRITSDHETSAVVLLLSEDKVEVRSQDKWGNTATEELDASWHSPDRTAVFNHRHLTDMLDSIDAPNCTFLLGRDTKTRRSNLLLRDDASASLGVLTQQRADWVMG